MHLNRTSRWKSDVKSEINPCDKSDYSLSKWKTTSEILVKLLGGM